MRMKAYQYDEVAILKIIVGMTHRCGDSHGGFQRRVESAPTSSRNGRFKRGRLFKGGAVTSRTTRVSTAGEPDII